VRGCEHEDFRFGIKFTLQPGRLGGPVVYVDPKLGHDGQPGRAAGHRGGDYQIPIIERTADTANEAHHEQTLYETV
jgi:hypothetical protein